MLKTIGVAVVTVAASGVLLAPAAVADDSGNHEAIWKANQHMALECGCDWGDLIGSLASSGGLKPTGVSEGVHDAKGQAVPGQNR